MREKYVSTLVNAVMNNQLTKVAKLLKYGANPNRCENNLLYSPLHYAAAHCRGEMAILLLNAGADLEAKDIDGFTPLNTAWLHHNISFIIACQKHQPKEKVNYVS